MIAVRLPLALTALAVAALAPAAHAAVWSQPQQVSGEHAGRPFAAVTPSGGGAVVAWWTMGSGTPPFLGLPTGVGYSSRRDSASPFAPPRDLAGAQAGIPALAAPAGAGRIVFSRGEPDGSTALVEAAGPLGSPFADPAMRLHEGASGFTDRAGNVLAVYDREGQDYATWSPAGGGFGTPLALGRQAPPPTAVLDGAGGATVAWTEGNPQTGWAVHVADCDGSGCGHEQVVSDPANSTGNRAFLAANRRGDVAVAWQLNDGYPSSHTIVTRYRAMGSGFGPARMVRETVGPGADSPLVALDERGHTLLLWGNGFNLRAALVPAAGPPGPPEDLPSTISAAAAGFDSRGNAVVAWATDDSDRVRRVHAAERVPGGGWAGPQTIAAVPDDATFDGRPVSYPQDVALALDDSARGLVAWSRNPDELVFAADYDGSAVVSPLIAAAVAQPKRAAVQLRYRLRRRATVRASLDLLRCAKGRCTLQDTVARGSAKRRLARGTLKLRRRGGGSLAPGQYRATVVAGKGSGRDTRRVHLRVR
jgi:hypothetical protein